MCGIFVAQTRRSAKFLTSPHCLVSLQLTISNQPFTKLNCTKQDSGARLPKDV